MNSVFSPLVKSLFVTLLAVSATAFADEHKSAPAAPKIDPAKGATLYTDGDTARGLPACVSCHGASGAGIPVQYPRLSGQHQDYTVAQLGLFKAGTRKSVEMATIAKRMSDEEMKAVADYVAGLK
jgi:cytochrome c553